MPFIAPMIGAAIGGIAATTLGQAVIGAALSVAMGALSARLAPKSEASSTSSSGAHLSLAADAQMPRVLVLGETAVAGSLVYHQTYNGTANLQLVIAIADHGCEAMTGLWINGEPVTWDSGSGSVTEYPGMTVRFHSGAWGQSADSGLVANSGGAWTSNDSGQGVAYAVVDMAYDAALYKGGLPSFLFRIKGVKFYDWRKDSTAGGSGAHRWGVPSTYEWTDNPVVVWYNYRRGIFVNGVRVFGMATPADALPLAAATAAANACDEAVALDGGGTERRYRLSAAVVATEVHREVIRNIVTAAGGEEIDTGGEFVFAPAISQAPVMALTDDDLVAEAEVEWVGRQSRKDLVNAVFGSFRDPAQRYEAVDVAPRLSAADEMQDGLRLEQRYDLDMVASGTQAQRILEILRRRARRQGVARATFRAKACPLEPGDWITWTSDRYGWTAKSFEVVTPSTGADLSTELVLREVDADVYAWDPLADEQAPGEALDLPAGGTPLTSLSGVAVSNIVVGATASIAERPGLQLAWTPVDDPSVVEIEIEVRRQGDLAPLNSRKAFDPSSGQYSWVDGIIGGTVYEVRARPVPQPARSVTWSAWVTPAVATAPQIVEFGTPLPASVGVEELDAQTKFELQLITALGDLQGSMAEGTQRALDEAQRAAEEALRAMLATQDVRAAVRVETIERSTATSALAAQITSALTAIGDNTALVTEAIESVDGIRGQWTVAIDVNGQVAGLVRLDGDDSESQFTVVADKFVVAHPTDAGVTKQIFTVGAVDGVTTVGIDADDVLIDGTVTARHMDVLTLSAIAADLGEVIAGLLRSPDNKFRISLTGKSIIMEV